LNKEKESEYRRQVHALRKQIAMARTETEHLGVEIEAEDFEGVEAAPRSRVSPLFCFSLRLL